MNKIRFLTLFSMLCLLTGLLFTGCGDTTTSTQTAKPAASKAPAIPQAPDVVQASSNPQTASEQKIKFKGSDGSEAIVIKRYADHDKIEIKLEGVEAVFKGRSGAENRRKYKEAADGSEEKALVAEVKLQSDSFKLVDEAEKLLWKVRIKDGKIKISDNEEGDNSCEIKSKSDDKHEIRNAAGEEIGNVKYYADNGKLKVKNANNQEILVSKDLKSSAAPGVILFSQIPVKHRAIIISELIRMGK